MPESEVPSNIIRVWVDDWEDSRKQETKWTVIAELVIVIGQLRTNNDFFIN
jgi:hypothetical protein